MQRGLLYFITFTNLLFNLQKYFHGKSIVSYHRGKNKYTKLAIFRVHRLLCKSLAYSGASGFREMFNPFGVSFSFCNCSNGLVIIINLMIRWVKMKVSLHVMTIGIFFISGHNRVLLSAVSTIKRHDNRHYSPVTTSRLWKTNNVQALGICNGKYVQHYATSKSLSDRLLYFYDFIILIPIFKITYYLPTCCDNDV